MDFNLIIVDDDEIILMLLKRIVQKSGFHDAPHFFNSAEKALSCISEMEETKPILVFLDINMPVMDGWELLDILHQGNIKTEINIIMVTSSIDLSDKVKAFTYPKVIDFVAKPFDIEVLQKIEMNLPWRKQV
jgi:CheY-like chemotaxis protein